MGGPASRHPIAHHSIYNCGILLVGSAHPTNTERVIKKCRARFPNGPHKKAVWETAPTFLDQESLNLG